MTSAQTSLKNEKCGFTLVTLCRQRCKALFLAVFAAWYVCVPWLLADTHYVSPSGGNVSPYTNWATAARFIQDAIDVSTGGDTVLVTNGVFATGGKAVYGLMTNRVAIDKAITVQSVSGPGVTVIEGAPAPGTANNGDGAVRCVYVGTDAVLSGFALTNGHTRTAGNFDNERSGGSTWCEASGVLTNCILTGNSASHYGGGAYSGTLNNCTLIGNSAYVGGGAFSATLNSCTLSSNSANAGGGVYSGTLNNCTLTGNSAGNGGGGALGNLNNCTLTGNSASYYGGGAYGSTLNNCTLSGNSASQRGGGTSGSMLNNCIVYYNTAPNGSNYYESSFTYSCTTPLLPGLGNIDSDPLLTSASHLSAQSPCIGHGSPNYTYGVDIDGEVWLNPPCMGADQFVSGSATGELVVAINAAYTNVGARFEASFMAQINGRLTASVWDFGDGVVVSNRPYASHAWAAPGLYTVRLTGYNNNYPDGVSTAMLIRVAPSFYYVNAANPNPAFPYTNWATAATTIQEAIDASVDGATVLVTNGVYATGGQAIFGLMTNRVVIDKAITVQSVNGPDVTVIAGAPAPGTANNGDGAVRCVYVGTNAVLTGFTLTNGYTRTTGDDFKEQGGGGVWCEDSGMVANCSIKGNSAHFGGGAYGGILNNCTLIGNSTEAYGYGGGTYDVMLNNCTLTGNMAYAGGGASDSTLNNCTLTGNSAIDSGGGAFQGTLNNCTLTGNSAHFGGGAWNATLNNCIVYYNTAPNGLNYCNCRLTYSCTTPLPPGLGNIDTDPLLASDTHLSAQSPCIGRGSTNYASGVDMDGEAWLNPPCMGADQFVAGAATGELTVAIAAAYTNVGTGFAVSFVAHNDGPVTATVWDFGDGLVVSNRAYASHAWTAPGFHTVRLTGYNDSFPDGITATVLVQVAAQEVYYVNAANLTPRFPYTNWTGAATIIQAAIDAGTQPGRLVRVTNGVYASGDRTVFEPRRAVSGPNRVVVAEGVQVRSENGPLVTVIAGQTGIRCVYVGTNAMLNGFTLTNGHTWSGGGAWCEASGVVTNCTLTGNSAEREGGGAYGGILNNCTLIGNSATEAYGYGGGAAYGMLNNCALTGNSASYWGGGAAIAMLNNCTLTGNSAGQRGGGTSGSTLNNCIVYYNTAPNGPNYYESSFSYSCTVPLPPGLGNIDRDPLLASATHLSTQSPCLARGSPDYAHGVDIDGEAWRTPPCMGADQFVAGAATGELTVTIIAGYTNVGTGFPISFAAYNTGPLTSTLWDFGDGSVASNRPYASHAWAAPGIYAVRLTAYNDSYPGGVSATVLVQVAEQEVYYVNAANLTPVFPYTNWLGAAATIQAAIAAGTQPGRLVRVTNGVYDSGGYAVYREMTNRVVVPEGVEVRSENGPLVTVITGRGWLGTTNNGDGAVRCAYVGPNAVLSGFTLTNGYTRTTGDDFKERNGGGAWCEVSGVLTNCSLTGNSAEVFGGGAYGGTLNNCTLRGNSAGHGGGAAYGTLNKCTLTGNSVIETYGSGGGATWCTLNNCTLANNSAGREGGGASWCALNSCTLTGNSANDYAGGAYNSTLNNCSVAGNSAQYGGGTFYGTLNNCTLTGNSASSQGGGVFGATLNNCIVYYNTTPIDPNYSDSSISYSCITPLPSGKGNIDNPPTFQDAPSGNFRLNALSPCIDAGANADGMFKATDLEGNPRIRNGRVDMGAYEFVFTVNLRVLLQGSYNSNTHAMVFSNPTNLPLTSPYANDPISVTAFPSNMVDWVLVELINTNGNTALTKSAFLDAQGQVLSTDSSTNFTAEVTAGYYSIVVKHRNHLAAMSAQPVAFTNILVTYDFTTDVNKYSGGSNAAVEVESGVWAMPAGDADGDGLILPVDAVLNIKQIGRSGYARADFNLDGTVTTNDLALWSANLGRQSGATHGETILQPGLNLTPSRKTVLAGATLTFTVSGGTGTSLWYFAQSPSGGTLTSLSTTSAVYTAGSDSNCVDIVEAWDGDRLGRAYINVISAAEVARSGKSLVIAGRRSSDDPLWPTTEYLANFAYNDLLYRGFAKRNLQFLSPEPNQDVDGNGAVDDIALPSTKANAAFTFTNWAMSNPDRLFIYLVDHGGSSSGAGYFRLNDTETLTAVELGQWLDNIQNRYSNEVVLVLDFCESGSFLAPLRYSGPGKRTVITACATNEPTYFVAGGLVSFSDAFFNGVLSGLDVADAFEFARAAMLPYQSAWLDADGDGVYVPANDLPRAAGTYIGASFVAGKDVPEIGHVMGGQALNGMTTSTLWAYDIASIYPIEQVWCLVVPPSHQVNPTNPVADLPVLELTYNPDTGRYEAQYSGFSELGLYKLIYYAKDIWDSVSQPQPSYVQQNGFQEKVILVAGSFTNSPNWAGIDNLAQMAYNTCRNRRFAAESIYYLSPLVYEDADQNGTNDVRALGTASNLCYAITNWAVGANKLTVYLVGEGANNLFRLNETEILAPSDLQSWLDIFQSTNGEVQVVMDFPGSGAYLPFLASSNRLCLASAKAGQSCLFANRGMVSFSWFFLPSIFSGRNLNLAFVHAREAIRNASGLLKQEAQLDDNGDGISDKTDGRLALTRYIGPAFLTGADAPEIGSVITNITLKVGNNLLLWAHGVVAVDGISNVWCVVTPPDYDGREDLAQVNLVWNVGVGRYEALYTNFTQSGTYVFTFYACDNNGQVSSARQCEVTVTDAYEPDDTALQATVFPVGEIQRHTFHSATDEDWVKFYAPTGMVFEVRARQLGTNSDLRLDLYYQRPDGMLTNVDWTDNCGTGSNVTESLTLDLKTGQSGMLPGGYYLRVSSADTNWFGLGSEYELQIYLPVGTGGGVVLLSPWIGGTLFTPGWLQVAIGPQTALNAGAGWRLAGHPSPAYYSNNATLYGLLAGGYTMEFKSIPGCQTPTNRPIQIVAEQTTIINGNYIVLAPGFSSPMRSTNGIFSFGLSGQPGTIYLLEASTNLGQTNWTLIATNTMGANGVWQFTDPASTNLPRRYYRGREQ